MPTCDAFLPSSKFCSIFKNWMHRHSLICRDGQRAWANLTVFRCSFHRVTIESHDTLLTSWACGIMIAPLSNSRNNMKKYVVNWMLKTSTSKQGHKANVYIPLLPIKTQLREQMSGMRLVGEKRFFIRSITISRNRCLLRRFFFPKHRRVRPSNGTVCYTHHTSSIFWITIFRMLITVARHARSEFRPWGRTSIPSCTVLNKNKRKVVKNVLCLSQP